MILAIDTVAPVVGVGAIRGDRTAVRTERVVRGTETRLPTWIEEVCAELGGAASDLTGVAVAVGPGAFTGLRVGIATATGLAMALGLPVFTCHALLPRASRLPGGTGVVLLDARKGRLYAARYVDGAERTPPEDVLPETALAGLPPGFAAVGEGALVWRGSIEAAGGVVAPAADDPAVLELARRAVDAFAAGLGEDPTRVAPLYLREPDAIPTSERRAGWSCA